MNDIEVLLKKYCVGEQYVPIQVVAEKFDMSLPTIYRLAATGKMPSYKIGGKRRFKISELEESFKA